MSKCKDHATDLSGRPWARISQTKAGDKLVPDAGFTCMMAGVPLEVKANVSGLYLDCDEGGHFLDGQADDGEHLVGLYNEH